MYITCINLREKIPPCLPPIEDSRKIRRVHLSVRMDSNRPFLSSLSLCLSCWVLRVHVCVCTRVLVCPGVSKNSHPLCYTFNSCLSSPALPGLSFIWQSRAGSIKVGMHEVPLQKDGAGSPAEPPLPHGVSEGGVKYLLQHVMINKI